MWTASPTCAHCGRMTIYPYGFELDHKVALDHGGQDSEANMQVLCVYYEGGRKVGCHVAKTEQDLGYTRRAGLR